VLSLGLGSLYCGSRAAVRAAPTFTASKAQALDADLQAIDLDKIEPTAALDGQPAQVS